MGKFDQLEKRYKSDKHRTLCFEREQVNRFISNWFRETEKPELGQQLQGKLAEAESARIFDLVKNPLRLSLLCKAWWLNPGTLPTTQADLYQQFRDDFYTWKQQQFPTSWSQRAELNRRLGQLAFRATAEKSPLRQSLVYAVLSPEWFELAEKLGWLNLVYRDIRTDEPIYAFFHLTFQEYFAALAVDDWDEFLPRNHVGYPLEGEEYRIFQPQWKQVILLWLGRGDIADEKKEEFIQTLVNLNDGCGKWNFEKVNRGFYEYRAYFLAAAGISEFKSCSLGDAIVQQIVQWGFGDYNQEKQEWRTFLDSIKEAARETLPQTDRKRAIQELCQILKHPQCGEDTRMQAAYCLGKIDPGNETAIAALVKVIETSESEWIRGEPAYYLRQIGQGNPTAIAAWVRILETTESEEPRIRAALSLGEVDPGNETAIAALVEIFETTKSISTRRHAVKSLGKIDPGNPTAISFLVGVIETTKSILIRREAVESLEKIDPGNPTAIAALVKLLETTEDEHTRKHAAKSLGKIDPGNQTAIAALVKLLETTEDKNTRWQATNIVEKIGWQAASSLGEIEQGNKTAIAALVKVIETTDDEYTRWHAAKSLGKIDPGNQTAIAEFVKLLETTENESTRSDAAYILGEIAPGNETAIAALVEIFETTEDKNTRSSAAYSLDRIGLGNETAIAALVEIFETTEDKNTRWQAAVSLGEINPGNQTAIAEFVKVIETTESKNIRRYVADRLEKIITTDENRRTVVTSLQPYLKDETYENNFYLFENCHKVLWEIAQDLPYPDFYRAWHG